MKKHIRQQLISINKSFNKFRYRKTDALINQCVDALKNNGQIVVSALGKNEPVAEKFVSSLKSVGIRSQFLNTNSAMHGDLGILRSEDLVLLLSKSGETKETIDLAKIISKRRVKCWLLTSGRGSTTSKYATRFITIPVDSEGDPWGVLPNNSVVIYLIFLQALALELIDRFNIPISVFRSNHPGGGIGKKLMADKARKR